ncbi:hypothetical protein C9374_003244 [Naegleria lovaniensis]|uniref:Strictosidine synthase conserved region domain-containing protein n=1 Tax=Naegleria lovaniensis TaxID=51637 RepID=A0AA88GTB3_NAELO|nr:uncharacterized protein C9374_003244 [Naegleria lovaniensis]KAG2385429.1 hypothetical protein C9374_003244 [Naegleria lovaniensis]
MMVSATRIREKTFINSRKIGLGVLTGPESFAWDLVDQDILYTGIADGSIRRVNVTSGESTVFAYSVPSLNATTRATCGLSVWNEPICGRVLGLTFDHDRNLIVADAYKGILRISFNNPSQVQVLVNSYQGVPIKMVNSVVVMPDGKTIYFTDSSLAFSRMQFVSIVLANSADSRLFKFHVETGELQLVISDLRFGNGIALSSDHSFLVINECSERRIRKYYLTGRKAGTNVVFVEDIGGYPDNIKTDEDGNFLVGLYAETNADVTAVQSSINIKNIFLKHVPPLTALNMVPVMGLVKKLDRHGRVISVYVDRTATFVSQVSEADVHEGKMYLGSVLLPWLTVVDLSTDLQLN